MCDVSNEMSVSMCFVDFSYVRPSITVDPRAICAFCNYAYCFRVAFPAGTRVRTSMHACVNHATRIEPCGASYVRRTYMHDRRRHLVWLLSPIINARHMPRSLIRWFYTPVCPVCLWWHVTAVKAASSFLGRSISQIEGGRLINTVRVNSLKKLNSDQIRSSLPFSLLNLTRLFQRFFCCTYDGHLKLVTLFNRIRSLLSRVSFAYLFVTSLKFIMINNFKTWSFMLIWRRQS